MAGGPDGVDEAHAGPDRVRHHHRREGQVRVNTTEIVQELIRAGAALVLQGSPGTTMSVAHECVAHIVDSNERTRRCDC